MLRLFKIWKRFRMNLHDSHTNRRGFGIWFTSPKKEDNGYETYRTWDVSTGVLNQLASEIFNYRNIQKLGTQRHMSKCLSTCGHVIFWPLSGGRMPCPLPGSHCYGLLRKRQNGGRPEALEEEGYHQLTRIWVLQHISFHLFRNRSQIMSTSCRTQIWGPNRTCCCLKRFPMP